MSRYVWIGYTDYSEDKKADVSGAQLEADDVILGDRWFLKQVPLWIPPSICLWLMYRIFGIYVLSMFFWIGVLFAVILGLLGLTKIYELYMYGLIGGKNHLLYEQLVNDRQAIDMKLGNLILEDHFFENYEIRDTRFKHGFWGYLPQCLEALLYLLLYTQVFSIHLLLMALMLMAPSLLAIGGMIFLTRAKLPRTRHNY